MPNPKDGKLGLLPDNDGVLVLVDFQPTMFAGVSSWDKTIIRNTATCAAKAAGILMVPVVFSAIGPQRNWEFIVDVTKLFPGMEVITRAVPSYDAFDDEKIWNAFKKTGRKNVIIAGLWTNMCFTYTTLHAIAGRIRGVWADGCNKGIQHPMLTGTGSGQCCRPG